MSTVATCETMIDQRDAGLNMGFAFPQKIVREIPASRPLNALTTQAAILLASYGRVSSDSDEQLESFVAQEEHFTTKYASREGVTYVGHFADEAKSGKFMRNRKEFNDLLQACYEGRVNRIVTKSVARFARNNIECMQIARDLKNRGVTIFFEIGGIDTADENAFVILALLSVLAEEEIRTLSQNIIWGFRKRNAEGKVTHGTRLMGYHFKDGKTIIIPTEAIVVKEVFDNFLAGQSYYQIVDGLNKRQVPKPNGNTKWTICDLERMLVNEKYCGDVKTHKTWAPDIMLPRRENDENVPFFEILDHHIGIVSRETFKKAKVEIERRRIDKLNLTQDRGRYSSKYALSGKLMCECGSKFRRMMHRRYLKSGEKIEEFVWVCIAHQGKKGCPARPIKEQIVQDAFVTALNGLVRNRSQFEEILTNNIREAVCANVGAVSDDLRAELESAQKELIRKSNDKESAGVQELIEKIQSLKNSIELADKAGSRLAITELKLEEAKRLLTQPLSTFNDTVFRSQVQQVLIATDNRGKPTKLRFIFSCGIEVTHNINGETSG